MVSASTALASRCALIIRQCDALRASIFGKSSEVADILADEFVLRQKLENLYKSILLDDVQYALDNKVELELWNSAFKEHIDNFRQKLKENKVNEEKNDMQAKLSLFLDASSGFYFQLLQEFCDAHDLDLPYHGKACQLGILNGSKNISKEIAPALNPCLYICQDCLVHLGDLARYRNDLEQAHGFYMLAGKLLAGNGQPYNQLAILASARNNQLQAVFYYCKSISVPNPFPAACSNLHKTFSQICGKHNYNVLAKSNGVNADEFIDLFLHLNGCIFLIQDLAKLTALKEKILQDIKEVLLDLSQSQIILLTGICVFNLYKNKRKDEEIECITEDESDVWHLILSLSVGILQVLVDYSLEMLRTLHIAVEHFKCLPAIKVLTDWIMCNAAGLFEEEYFQENPDLYYQLAVLGNELQQVSIKREKSVLPLLEDWEMHGMVALRKVHRRYDFRIQPIEVSTDQVWAIRVSRILHFLDWLTQQHQPSRFIAKKEVECTSEYVCLLSQGRNTNYTRSKSPFSEKSRSLFRTDSEECGAHDVPSVQGPVASYSLFDTMWSANIQNAPQVEANSVTTVGSPLLPLSSVSVFTITSGCNPQQECEPQTTTHDPLRPSLHCQPQPPLPVCVSVAATSAIATTHHFSHIPTVPLDVSNSTPALIQGKSVTPPGFHDSEQLSEQQIARQLAPLVPRAQGMLQSPVGTVGQHPLPVCSYQRFPTIQQMNRSLPPPIQQHQSGQISTGNVLSLTHQFASGSLPEGQLHLGLIQHGLPPQTFMTRAIAPPSPSFGAIGQGIRAPSGMSSNQIIQPHLGSTAPIIAASTPSANPQHQWLGPIEGMTTHMMSGNRSIWSSNFAIGEGELSPLEQLLQEQRRHQRPK